ncbi:hypothetical protein QTP88_002011 [Uroleucon formosanum]
MATLSRRLSVQESHDSNVADTGTIHSEHALIGSGKWLDETVQYDHSLNYMFYTIIAFFEVHLSFGGVNSPTDVLFKMLKIALSFFLLKPSVVKKKTLQTSMAVEFLSIK